MNRNSMRKILTRLLILFGFISPLSLFAADTPNVVLIISDDQAWGDYGFMGHPHIQTPHLDRLARESLTFTRGYVPDSLCRPSLATIVTGKYPHEHGIVGNDPPPPKELEGMPKGRIYGNPQYIEVRNKYIEHIDDELTMADALHENLGYVSHQSGKWWEGHYSRGGFTEGMTHGDRTRGGRHGDEGLTIGRQGMKPVFEFLDHAVAEKKPFFVYYAPFLPHTPHNPPQRLLKKYQDKTPHEPVAKYWAMCEWFDETCGELLDYLDQHQLADNTIVLYVTDNGWINQTDSSRYAPKSKRSQYDGGTRTPIMIRWPGKVPPKMDTEHLASSIDLMPTVLKAVGIEPSSELQGIDLLDKEAVSQRTAIFGEILEHDIRSMDDPVASLRFRWIIDGDWKLIVPFPGREPDASVELYHITQDPNEENNVAEANPNRVRKLTRQLDAWWNPQG
ncbi:MAG: sulfatase [Planctomycetaceae bacterium]|nr:sulfatase [Planctomycetaceae bacterium]